MAAYKTGEIPYRYWIAESMPSLYFPKLGPRVTAGAVYKSAMFPFGFWILNFIPPKYFQDFSISELFVTGSKHIVKFFLKVRSWL